MRYTEKYKRPERFVQIDDQILAIPMPVKSDKERSAEKGRIPNCRKRYSGIGLTSNGFDCANPADRGREPYDPIGSNRMNKKENAGAVVEMTVCVLQVSRL